MTGLMYASLYNNIDVVKYLLGLPGINIFIENIEEDTALILAIKKNNIDVVKRILQQFNNKKINKLLSKLLEEDNIYYEYQLFTECKFDYIYTAFHMTANSPLEIGYEIHQFMRNTYPLIDYFNFI
jgi:ankyrin repeat protein